MKNFIIWTFGLAIALSAGLTAIGAIAKDKAPALAVTLSPMNGFAAGNIAAASIKNSIAKNQGKFPDRVMRATMQLARTAFLAEPVTPEAVAVLALAESEDGQRKLMNNALLLSRRQSLVTGWMVADSLERKDSQGILEYYDVIMRTDSSAQEVIIPVIVNALANQNFIKPLLSILSEDPPWQSYFWQQAARSQDAAVNAAEVRQMLYSAQESTNIYQDAVLINTLVSNQQFVKADLLYRLLTKSRNEAQLVRNSEFSRISKYPPIDWQLISRGNYHASIDSGTMNLSAVGNSGGLFAQQLVKLPASLLVLTAELDEPVPSGAELAIEISCAENIAEKPNIIRIGFVEKSITQAISNREALCRYYWLKITGRSSNAGNGSDITIKKISLLES